MDDWYENPYLSVGSYGGLDDRHKLRKRKQPVGFAPPSQPKKKPTRPKKKQR